MFLVRKFKQLVSWFIPPDLESESPKEFKTQAIVSVSFLVGMSGFPFMLLFFYMGHPREASVVLWSWLFFMGIPFLARKKWNPKLLAHLLAANYFQCHLFLCLIWGGVDAPNSMWFAAMPIVSMLVGGISHGFIWGAITTVSVLAIYSAERFELLTLTTSLEAGEALFVFGTGTVALLGAVLGSTAAFEMFRMAAMSKRLEAEERLLQANSDLQQRSSELESSVKRVEQLLKEVEAANDAKGRFLAQISHELRTPLNGILGTAEALREGVYGQLSPHHGEALQVMDRAARHQLALVNDLLDFSKIEDGNFEPTLEAVSVGSVADHVIEILRERAKQGNIEIEQTIAVDAGLLLTDRRRLQQMLLNLVGNAIKFSPAGGTVTLSHECDTQWFDVHVEDTGIGIDPAELPRMFEAFTQIDSVLQRKHDGTGLGLSLTSKFAELLGGKVLAKSEVGKGSRFTIRLPNLGPRAAQDLTLTPLSDRKDSDVGQHAPSDAGTVTPDTSPSSEVSQRHVLLVDDTPGNIGHVRDFLEAKGHRVTVATNGIEAIEKAQSLPDITFMDVQMPEMDGLEAIRRLRADPNTASLYIVSLTSFARGEDRERCLAAGADDYESKPVSLKRVLQFVESLPS